MSTESSNDFIVLGKISSVYGVKGWVKVFSYTEPMDRILEYGDWTLRQGQTLISVEVDKGRSHGKGMVAHLKGVDDREIAKKYSGAEICVPKDRLPELDEGEYYWYELEGLAVITTEGVVLGEVDHLMAAGPGNDVVVVKGNANSIDKRERLIPHVDQFIIEIDLAEGQMIVDWDPEF